MKNVFGKIAEALYGKLPEFTDKGLNSVQNDKSNELKMRYYVQHQMETLDQAHETFSQSQGQTKTIDEFTKDVSTPVWQPHSVISEFIKNKTTIDHGQKTKLVIPNGVQQQSKSLSNSI